MLRLKGILEESPIGIKGYAKLLGLSQKGLYNKLSEASAFTYPEYLRLRELLPEYNIDYLLTRENKKPGT